MLFLTKTNKILCDWVVVSGQPENHRKGTQTNVRIYVSSTVNHKMADVKLTLTHEDIVFLYASAQKEDTTETFSKKYNVNELSFGLLVFIRFLVHYFEAVDSGTAIRCARRTDTLLCCCRCPVIPFIATNID